MVAIRLTRTGAKKKPTYRVVVMDKRRARDSKTIEILGHYNPRPSPVELDLKRERVSYWLGVGAQPSETVKRLIKRFDESGAVLAQPKRETAQKTAVENRPAPKPEKPAEEPVPAAAEVKAEPEAKAETEPAAKAEAEPEAKAETEPAAKAEAETKPAAKPEAETEVKAEVESAEEPAAEAAVAPEAADDQPKAEAEEKPAETDASEDKKD